MLQHGAENCALKGRLPYSVLLDVSAAHICSRRLPLMQETESVITVLTP